MGEFSPGMGSNVEYNSMPDGLTGDAVFADHANPSVLVIPKITDKGPTTP